MAEFARGLISAYQAGTQERQADQKRSAIASYLPGALAGDRDQAAKLSADAPEMAVQMTTYLNNLDDQTRERELQDSERLGPMLYGKDGQLLSDPRDIDHVRNLFLAGGGSSKKAALITPENIPILAQGSKAAREYKQQLEQKAHQDRMFNETARSNRAQEANAAARAQGGGPLTAADKREAYDAKDLVEANNAAISLLTQALDLSGESLSGYGSGTIASVGAALGNKKSENTLVFDNLLKRQVLPQLRATFGGNPTEGERQILLDLEGSSSLPVPVRNEFLTTAKKLAERRLQYNTEKFNEIVGGTFFKPGGQAAPKPGAPAAPPPSAPGATGVIRYDAQGNRIK
jgi:hypothetical protein